MSAAASEQARTTRGRFLIVFLGLQAALFTLELLQPVREVLIDPFTRSLATISAALIQLFDAQVVSYGIYIESLRAPFILRIEAGCNGVEPMIILAAAILAFPATLRERLVGLGLGFAGIQGINLIRIISLFYIGQWNMAVYEWAHLYVWQALILLDAFVIWLLWVRYLRRHERRAS